MPRIQELGPLAPSCLYYFSQILEKDLPMTFLTARLTNLVIFIGCVGLILTALGFQEILGLHPCALCITQRIFVVAVGLVALAACLHNPAALGRRLYAGIGIIAAAIGAGFSARHMYLQGLSPEEMPSCGPGLEYMFENFPVTQAFELLLRGDGHCGDIVWQLLGLSMPAWVLIAFVGLAIVNLWQMARR